VEKGLSQNTIVAYRSDLEKLRVFAEEIGKDFLSIERSDITSFIQHLSKSGLEPRSIGRTLVTVRGLYRFLLLGGRLNLDKRINIETPKSWQSLPKFLLN